MKPTYILLASLAGLLTMAITTPVFAAEQPKETTITGDAMCAKCALHDGTKCQTVIEAKNPKGKMVKYYLVQNDVSKEFHKNVCTEAKKATATGTIKRDATGKHEFTATKIELVK